MAIYQIKHAVDSDRQIWDGYVRKHPDASLFHLFGWRRVIHNTYGHETHYLMAVRAEPKTATEKAASSGLPAESIAGIFPLVHLRHLIFGNTLISLPFLDGGGILADCREVEESLLSEAIRLGLQIGANRIELRSERPIAGCDELSPLGSDGLQVPLKVGKRINKVRMLLKLPESSDMLLKSLKSKLRSQINKPLKEGCTSSIGGVELLEDFYRVFLINMRDLGSPVHSMDLMRHVLGELSERARIIVVYKSKEPVASALAIGFNKILRNPWASSDRKYASMGPNMLLYLRMLEYGCDNGYQVFDFGRSTIGEGTYRFKEQWGATPVPLHWYLISLDGKSLDSEKSGTERFEWVTHYWKKLPLIVTKVIGPRLRKHISL